MEEVDRLHSQLLFMELDTIQGVRENFALVSANPFLKSEGKDPGRINGPSLDWSEINEKVKILEISKSSQHFETTLPL